MNRFDWLPRSARWVSMAASWALVVFLAGAAVAGSPAGGVAVFTGPVPGAGRLTHDTPSRAEGRPGKRYPLTILHTNDVHAAFTPVRASWRADMAWIGGFEMLDATVSRVRAEVPNVLLLDAGDMMTGNPISRLEVEGVPGWGLFSLMNIVQYDAWALGNHDFDQGQPNLHAILRRLDFPTLSANLHVAPDSPIAGDFEPYVIETVGPLRVGIIGIVTPDLAHVASADAVAGVQVADPVSVLREQVAAIDPRTDVIVVLSHAGDAIDRKMAAAVDGVDVIVGGHTHKRIYPPEKIGDTLVVQAGSRLQYLGRLDLVVARDRVVSYTGKLIPLWLRADVPVSSTMRDAVARARSQVDAAFGVRVGVLEVPWVRNYYGESNVGDWIADALRRRAGTDIAFLNSGGIRNNLPAGPVTRGDLMTVLPFENQLCTFEVTGAGLQAIVEADARAALRRAHGILQVSGLRYTYTEDHGAVRLVSLEVGGAPVAPDRVYTAATNEYMLFSQPDKYFPGVSLRNPRCLGVSMVEAVAAEFERAGHLRVLVDGRIRQQ